MRATDMSVRQARSMFCFYYYTDETIEPAACT